MKNNIKKSVNPRILKKNEENPDPHSIDEDIRSRDPWNQGANYSQTGSGPYYGSNTYSNPPLGGESRSS